MYTSGTVAPSKAPCCATLTLLQGLTGSPSSLSALWLRWERKQNSESSSMSCTSPTGRGMHLPNYRAPGNEANFLRPKSSAFISGVIAKYSQLQWEEWVASFPVPRPAFCRLQYGRTASDQKLGVGLGTRLRNGCTIYFVERMVYTCMQHLLVYTTPGSLYMYATP